MSSKAPGETTSLAGGRLKREGGATLPRVVPQPRDIFPLPGLPMPPVLARGRRQAQRHGRVRRHLDRVNHAIAGLNWLAGFGDTLDEGYPTAMQQEVLTRVDGLAWRQEPTASCLSSEAAWSELLRGRGLYEEGGANANLAAYQEELLSVPSDIRGCPRIEQILPSSVHHYLEAYQERMLKPQEEMENLEKIEPYFDKKLFYNQKIYHKFVKRLHEAGLVHFVRRPKA